MPWRVPAALIALALVPIAAGAARLVELSGGAAALEPPCSAAAPVPLVVHIVSALVFPVVGVFQFVPGMRGSPPRAGTAVPGGSQPSRAS